MASKKVVVYLIHFDSKYKHVQHYLGSTNDLTRRLSEHGTPRGARLLQVITEHGIGYKVVRTWDGGFDLEIQLKKRKQASNFCPECQKIKKEINQNVTAN